MNVLQKTVVVVGVATLVACAGTPKPDPRVERIQAAYNDLVSNSTLAPFGQDEWETARIAVQRLTNRPKQWDDRDYELAIYSASRLVEIAEFEARARYADDRRQKLTTERERLVTAAREREAQLARAAAEKARRETEEAEAARRMALMEAEKAAEEAAMARKMAQEEMARAELAKQEAAEAAVGAELARVEAAQAMSEAEKARQQAAEAEARIEEARLVAELAQAERDALQSELADLKARPTERGLVLTIGDVLFEVNKADLIAGATNNLKPLVTAMETRPDQNLIIEGHTDSTGTRDYNLGLSMRRAQAVADFLTANGISENRITTRGLGPDVPVAGNDTSTGRQLNRRVEVILPQPEEAESE